MPNFDGGHYFLTALIPVLNDRLVEHGGVTSSAVHMIRRALSVTPTACQSPAAAQLGLNSPFARCTRTHFARFVLIDDLPYNGRDPVDAIKAAIRGINPVVSSSTDSLPWPYLLFVADVDAVRGEPDEPRGYLRELWSTMNVELKEILRFCVEFETVSDGDTFAAYIQRCQVETTMPFNDYWPSVPRLVSHASRLRAVAGVGLLVDLGVAISLWLWGYRGAAVASGLVGLAITVWCVYNAVMTRGNHALAAAPNSDLPSILKALYVQQKFTAFAIEVQGMPPDQLQAAFVSFVGQHEPSNVSRPTQQPGMLRAL